MRTIFKIKFVFSKNMIFSTERCIDYIYYYAISSLTQFFVRWIIIKHLFLPNFVLVNYSVPPPVAYLSIHSYHPNYSTFIINPSAFHITFVVYVKYLIQKNGMCFCKNNFGHILYLFSQSSKTKFLN